MSKWFESLSENSKKLFGFFIRFICVFLIVSGVSAIAFYVLEDINREERKLETRIEQPSEIPETQELGEPTLQEGLENEEEAQKDSKLLSNNYAGRGQFYGLVLFVLVVVISLYYVHLVVLIWKYMSFREKHTNVDIYDILSHFWYLLAIAIILPLFFSILPDLNFDFQTFNNKLASVLVHSFLSKLVTILLATELATLFAHIEMGSGQSLRERLLTHLMVAIVLDIITLIILYRIPEPISGIAFSSAVKFVIIYTSSVSFASSYASVFLITINKHYEQQSKNSQP